MAVAFLHVRQIRLPRDWQEDVVVRVRRAVEIERRREHGDNRVRLAVEEHRAAKDARVAAISTLPERLAEDEGALAVRPILVVVERAPNRQPAAERREELARDGTAEYAFGLAVTGQHAANHHRDGEILERGLPRAPVEEVRVGDGALVDGWCLLADDDESIGMRQRQRLEQDGVKDAEQRGVRGDGDGQCQHDHRGRDGRPASTRTA